MDFDFTTITAELRYKLLCSFVGPRPIALVTTLGLDGVANAAPMAVKSKSMPWPFLVLRGRV